MLKKYTNPEINKYYKILCKGEIPKFLQLYLHTPSVERLDGVGYFCGADYHQIPGQTPKYWYSRLNHSIACALITWNFTHNRQQTILALLHDIGTPCFSHAIDYGLKDAIKQESSERTIKDVVNEDKLLKDLLYLDGIDEDSLSLDSYSILEQKRPHLCVDRIEGILAPSLIWSQETNLEEIKNIYNDLFITFNEDGNEEFAFKKTSSAEQFFHLNQTINTLSKEKEDKLTMSLLGDILIYGEKTKAFSKNDLYQLTELDIIDKIKQSKNTHLKHYFFTYCNLKEVEISNKKQDKYYYVDIQTKNREVDPLVEFNDETIRLSQTNDSVRQQMIDCNLELPSGYPYIKLKWNPSRKKF